MGECTLQACLVHLGSTIVFGCLGGFLLYRVVLRRHWGFEHFWAECGIAVFEVAMFTACVCIGLFGGGTQ